MRTIEGSRGLIDYLGSHGMADRALLVIARSVATKQSSLFAQNWIASLALAMTVYIRPRYFAAITMISTLYWGAASLASTVARAGVLPAETHPSHTAFMSGKVFMSVI